MGLWLWVAGVCGQLQLQHQHSRLLG